MQIEHYMRLRTCMELNLNKDRREEAYFSSVGAETPRVRRLYFKQNDVVSSVYWGFIIRMA